MAVIVRLGEKRILAGAQKKLDDEYPPGAPAEKVKEKKEKKRKGEYGAKSGSKKVRR